MNFPQQNVQQQPMPQHQQQPQMVQQPPQQQQQPNPQQQQQQQRHEDKLLSKARELVGPLKEKWSSTVREAANKVQVTGSADRAADANQVRIYLFYCTNVFFNVVYHGEHF